MCNMELYDKTLHTRGHTIVLKAYILFRSNDFQFGKTFYFIRIDLQSNMSIELMVK
jgi:hypothetical protein